MSVGFNVGVFGKFPINKMVAIQPELSYSTKGAKVTYNNLLADGTVKYRLNYIEMPILLVINITKNFNI